MTDFVWFVALGSGLLANCRLVYGRGKLPLGCDRRRRHCEAMRRGVYGHDALVETELHNDIRFVLAT